MFLRMTVRPFLDPSNKRDKREVVNLLKEVASVNAKRKKKIFGLPFFSRLTKETNSSNGDLSDLTQRERTERVLLRKDATEAVVRDVASGFSKLLSQTK